MILVETYTPENDAKFIEKYDNIADFINEIGENASELGLQAFFTWDNEYREGMFYLEDSDGEVISSGLVEEIRNRTRVTIDDVLADM
jgi:hypothetical protein